MRILVTGGAGFIGSSIVDAYVGPQLKTPRTSRRPQWNVDHPAELPQRTTHDELFIGCFLVRRDAPRDGNGLGQRIASLGRPAEFPLCPIRRSRSFDRADTTHSAAFKPDIDMPVRDDRRADVVLLDRTQRHVPQRFERLALQRDQPTRLRADVDALLANSRRTEHRLVRVPMR